MTLNLVPPPPHFRLNSQCSPARVRLEKAAEYIQTQILPKLPVLAALLGEPITYHVWVGPAVSDVLMGREIYETLGKPPHWDSVGTRGYSTPPALVAPTIAGPLMRGEATVVVMIAFERDYFALGPRPGTIRP